MDDAGTHELVHHIRGTATPGEQAFASFTRRKLKQFPIGISGSPQTGNTPTLTRSRTSLAYRILPTWRHGVASRWNYVWDS
jgi:hypothetical protein